MGIINLESEGRAWSQWFLLRSDAHHDNRHCQQNLEWRHLNEANDRGAYILDFGDLFCAMQGKYDLRSDQSQLREEHRGNNYLDLLVSEAATFYGPYADRFLHLSPGNHEAAITKRHQTNLTERLAERLKLRGLSPQCRVGAYRGWLVFRVRSCGSARGSVKLAYHHGYGGGGPVTRGTIQTARQAVYLPDARIVVNGHTHDSWILEIVRDRLSFADTEYRETQWHVRVPGYKEEYGPGEGWHVERGGAPKPLGAWWLRLYQTSADSEANEIRTELVKAE